MMLIKLAIPPTPPADTHADMPEAKFPPDVTTDAASAAGVVILLVRALIPPLVPMLYARLPALDAALTPALWADDGTLRAM